VRRIVSRLIESGRLGSTPVAMVRSAYWDDEQIITSTLDGIAGEVDRVGIRPPAILVVGDVVRMRETLARLRATPGEAQG